MWFLSEAVPSASSSVTSLALSPHHPSSLLAVDTVQSLKGGYEDADSDPSRFFPACGRLGGANRSWKRRRSHSRCVSGGPGMQAVFSLPLVFVWPVCHLPTYTDFRCCCHLQRPSWMPQHPEENELSESKCKGLMEAECDGYLGRARQGESHSFKEIDNLGCLCCSFSRGCLRCHFPAGNSGAIVVKFMLPPLPSADLVV